jgi:hypothetical protein
MMDVEMRTTIVGVGLVPLAALVLALSACGDDDDDGAAATPPVATPSGEGGVDNPTSPALKAGDCPQAPVIKGLVKSSPVWGGVVVLRVQVPGGVPENVETQVFEPASNGWRQAGGDVKQEADGTFAIAVTVRPLQGGEDKPFKLRARANLQGCPRTAWAESEPFTLTNPMADTTWISETPVSATNQNIQISPRGATKAAGPYSFTAGATVYHSFTFAKDGTTSETFKFSVKSKTATDDAYNGCVFQIGYTGTWQIKLLGNRMTLFMGERTPKANPAEGSTCPSPTIAQLDITKTPEAYRLPASNTDLSYGIDYVSAALAEGQPIQWAYSAPFTVQNGIGNIFGGLSFTQGPDGASAFASVNNVDPYIRK